MGRVLMLALIAAGVWLWSNRRARVQAGELARDLSDSLMLYTLRATSGFAEDVPVSVQLEERERRLRWR